MRRPPNPFYFAVPGRVYRKLKNARAAIDNIGAMGYNEARIGRRGKARPGWAGIAGHGGAAASPGAGGSRGCGAAPRWAVAGLFFPAAGAPLKALMGRTAVTVMLEAVFPRGGGAVSFTAGTAQGNTPRDDRLRGWASGRRAWSGRRLRQRRHLTAAGMCRVWLNKYGKGGSRMKNMLMEAALRCGVELDGHMAEQMAQFWSYLKEVNQSMNLTRVDSDAEAVERHFIDSLAPLRAGLIPRGARVLDMGSGAGFPGMPLAIARPDADVTLMDALGKRVHFLEEAARRAGVHVSAVHARAEEAARGELRERFDVVTARAVARLNVLCELALPFVRVGGVLVAYKGPAADEELDEAAVAIKRLGGGAARVLNADLPGRDARLVVIGKLTPTPKSFPRRPGDAARKPL